ncbi:MAG: discoidin domain-containing protein [Burkholderiales bacterium]|nr:discoidin domain-containing protein [Burkholderiales bacterium]
MENEPAVARYAWFSGRSTQIPNVNLLGADGQLTELGRLYTSLPYLGNQAESEVVPVSAFASSQERGDLNAAAAIDNNLSTRWGSAFTDSEYLALDFGKSVTVTRLAINWENAHADSYQIQTSDDRNTWTTIRTVTGSTGGVENLTGLSGNGRYIRMLGLKRATQYGYSIYEIHAFTNSPPPTPVPTPVPTPTPNPVPVTAPGAVITPVAATSSAVENPSLSASNAIDGNLSTRWSSAFVDNAWLQIDLGVSQDIGYLKLVWENSYAKEYVIETSDDGQSWTVVRHVYNGNGGTEELFNLRAHGRYIRMQGIQRATQYGYSLWEVVVMSPGTDNTAPTYTPVALKTPQANEAPVSLYQPGDPVETLQFSLPDGTLITRFGNRAQNRHSRERGEQWNEIGYGPNETVDPVTGQPVDKGPGDFLNFVAHYFQYRTWGLEIVDNSNVPGVTKPTLQFHLYNNSIEFHNDTIAYFRRYDSPYVTGYGWMNGSSFATDLSNPFNTDTCAPVAFPVGKALGSPICSTLVTEYPGHAALDGNGFPIPGVNVPARPLVVGDFVEVSPSYFVNQAALTAKGDVGNARYYSGEWMYVVGKGITPWYGIQPRLNSVPLPADTLSGGTTSVSYNYSNNGNRMFEQAATNTGMQNMQRFVEGRRLVHTDFFTGKHTETVNEDYTPARGLAGPFYSKALCMACHTNNGRSDAIVNLNQRLDNMNVKTGVIGADGKVTAHPIYGETVQMNALSSSGNVQDWGNSVKVVGFDTRTLTLNDGTQVQLRKPQIGFDGPVPALYSLRSAPPMIGAGLLEAIPEADIIARARTTPDADGVQGVANYVYDPETGAPRLGRFGWKASRVSIRHQVASAFIHDMSVTTPVYPKKSCHADVADCRTGVGQPGVTEADLQKVVNYVSLLAVPAQRSLQSGFPKGVAPLPEHIVNPIQVASGRNTFAAINCVACHIAQMKTGSTHPFEELRNQTIHPYTDMLLHDMGDGLADNLPEGKASGRQWRTPALWGIGYTPWVQGGDQNVGYLHDGRARTLLEAIEWHGGEALKSRQRFENLSTADREAVLAFLRSL